MENEFHPAVSLLPETFNVQIARLRCLIDAINSNLNLSGSRFSSSMGTIPVSSASWTGLSRSSEKVGRGRGSFGFEGWSPCFRIAELFSSFHSSGSLHVLIMGDLFNPKANWSAYYMEFLKEIIELLEPLSGKLTGDTTLFRSCIFTSAEQEMVWFTSIFTSILSSCYTRAKAQTNNIFNRYKYL